MDQKRGGGTLNEDQFDTKNYFEPVIDLLKDSLVPFVNRPDAFDNPLMEKNRSLGKDSASLFDAVDVLLLEKIGTTHLSSIDIVHFSLLSVASSKFFFFHPKIRRARREDRKIREGRVLQDESRLK